VKLPVAVVVLLWGGDRFGRGAGWRVIGGKARGVRDSGDLTGGGAGRDFARAWVNFARILASFDHGSSGSDRKMAG